MWSSAENRLLGLAIAVSLALTGLTVWAVHRQGEALRQREWTDLLSSARTAAAEREAAWRAEVQRAADAAGRVWQAGGGDEFDVWAAEQRPWLLSYISVGGGAWQPFPRTPLEEPLPTSPESEGGRRGPSAESSEPPTTEKSHDLAATLESFKRLATSPDPLTRAGALLALATFEQRLGHPLAAAHTLADAAALLRSTPGLTRFAFRAELGRIDSLLAAGHHERAMDALSVFLRGLLADHPARLGPAELSHLEQQVAALGLPPDDPLLATLAELRGRVQRRESTREAAGRLLQLEPVAASQPTDELVFVTGQTAGGQSIVVAVRRVGDDVRAALVSPAPELLDRFWKSPPDQSPWKLARLEEVGSSEVLVRLGPAFANAALTPAPATAERRHEAQRRRVAVLLATAAGTTGAWALVLWMMTRVVARQRELARLRSRFVADISHELKTPLALIRLLSETLAEQRMRDPQRIQSYHQTITREADRLNALLDNILDMGRIESGRKRYEFGECDLAGVARQAWALFEPQFTEAAFDARLEVADNLPALRADAAALQQVLVNLLQNAYRYGGDGKYVRLSVAREGFVIVMAVEDHGIGMNRTQLQRLGESFFRAEDTRVRQTRGTGLGLAIVSHIVTAHRGKIEVQSHPGQGSRFTVWIPIEPAVSPLNAADPSAG